MTDRKASSLKTSRVTRTKLIWNGAALCVLSLILKNWMQKDFPEPPHMFVYFFNWTNMYDPLNAHVKPNFVQLGPYVFRADIREDSTWTWSFEKQMSIGASDDFVGTFHPPDPIVADRIRSWNHYMKKLMDFTLNTKAGCMVLDKAARKSLFEGYYDPLTETAKLLDTELIPWYFRHHNTRTKEWNNPVNVSFSTEGPVHMVPSDWEARGGVHGEGVFSDNDFVDILRDLSEFYVPFVIVTERVTMNRTLALLRKLAFCWLESYCLERVLCRYFSLECMLQKCNTKILKQFSE